MSILGRFSVDVQFQEASASRGVVSFKTIALQNSTEYDFGKVAVAAGTCGTAVAYVDANAPGYFDSNGRPVVFSTISRVAFSATGPNMVRCASDQLDGLGYAMTLYSRANQIAASESIEDNEFQVGVVGTSGTASYTLVLYGS